MNEQGDVVVAVKWAYRYYSLVSEEFGSLDDAIAAAEYASDAGSESLRSIEVFTPEHRVISAGDVWDMVDAHNERERAVATPALRTVAVVHTQGPDGDWSTGDAYSTREAATAEAARLRTFLGEARVRIDPARR